MALKERNEALSPINSIVLIHPTLKQRLLSNVLQTNDKETSYRIRVDSSLANTITIQSQSKKTNISSFKISKSIYDPEIAPFYWHNVRPFVESTLIGYHGMIIFLQSSHIQIQKVTPFELLFKSIDQILKCIYRSKYKHTQYFQVLFSHYALSIEGGHLFDLCRGLNPASYLYRENNGRPHKLIKTRLIDLEHLKGLIERNHAQFVSDLCQPSGASVDLSYLGYHEFICVNVGFLGFSASFAPIGGELTFVILSTDYMKDAKAHSTCTLDVASTTKLTKNTFEPLLAFLEKVTALAIDTDDEDPLCGLLRDGVGGACKTCFISSLPDRYGLTEFESEMNNEHRLILQIAHQYSLVVNCPNRKVFAEKALMNIYLHEINAFNPAESLNDSEVVITGEEGKAIDSHEVGEETIKQAAVALEQAVREFSDGLESEGFEYEIDIHNDNTHEISQHDHNETLEETCDNSQELTPQFNVDKSVKINFDSTIPNEPIESTTQISLEKRTVILEDSPDEVRKITTFIPDCVGESDVAPTVIPPIIIVTDNANTSNIITTEFSNEQINLKTSYKITKEDKSDDDIIFTPFQQQISDEDSIGGSQDMKFGMDSKKITEDPDTVEEFIYEEMITSERSRDRDGLVGKLTLKDNEQSTNNINISVSYNADESRTHTETGNESADTSRLHNSIIQIRDESAQIQSNSITSPVCLVTDNEIAGTMFGNSDSDINWDHTKKSIKKDTRITSTQKTKDGDLIILSPSSDIPVDSATEEGKRVKIEFEQENATQLESGFDQQEFLLDDYEFERNRFRPSEYPQDHSHENSQRTSHQIVQLNAQPILPKATTHSTQVELVLPPVNDKSEIVSITDWAVVKPEENPPIETEHSTRDTQLEHTITNSYPIPVTESSYDIDSPGVLQTNLQDDVDITSPLSIRYPSSNLLRDNTEQVDTICEEDSRDSKHTKNTMHLPFLSNDGEENAKRLEVNSPLLDQIDGNQGDAQIAEVVTFMLQDPVRGAARSHQARGSKEVLQRRDLGGVFTGHAIALWILNNVQGIRDWSEAEVFGQWLLDQDALIHSEGSFVFAGAESLFYYARRSQPCTGLLGSDEIKRLMSEARKVLQEANTEFYDAHSSPSMDKNEAFSALGIEGGFADDEMIYHQLMAEQNVVLNEASNNEKSLNRYLANNNQSQSSSDAASKQESESLSNFVSSKGKDSKKKFLWKAEARPDKVNSLNESQGSAQISDMFQTHDIVVRKDTSEPENVVRKDTSEPENVVRKDTSEPENIQQTEANNEVINVIERQQTVLVGNLTDKYVEINTQTFELHPLFANCRDGCRMGVLRNLVMSYGVNFEDEMKRTSLFYAAASDQIRVGQELINSHANVNHIDTSHISPLLVAVKLGHVSFMSMLLSHNADITHFDKTGTNAYHLACNLESPGCLQKLLRNIKPGVLDRIDKRGFTPLHYAIRNQFSGHVEKLLKHRPTLTILDSNGLSYLSFAICTHSFTCIALLIKSFPQLAGQRNADLSTPLHVAAIQSTPEYLALLLNTKSCRRHYNIQDGDNQGRSPLHAACKKGVDVTVRMLLQHNALVMPVDSKGLNSLHYAKANERLSREVVEFLEATEVGEVRGIMKTQDGGSKTCQIQ